MKKRIITASAALFLLVGAVLLIAPRISNHIGKEEAHSAIEQFEELKGSIEHTVPTQSSTDTTKPTDEPTAAAQHSEERSIDDYRSDDESYSAEYHIDADRLYRDSVAYNEKLKTEQYNLLINETSYRQASLNLYDYGVPNNIYGFEIWEQSSDQTQLIFSDLSTPTGKKSKGDDAFCAYEEIKKQLMLCGVPEEQIQFIQNFKSSKAKQKLFMDVRKGKVRVLIGSTEMMGTGMNVQHKLIALHHLDCPNRPADIEQREGRIIRQGNTNPTVQIYNYVTKGTFDAFMYQMVERKQKFISSVMTAKHYSERSADDIDEATLNYGQIKAVASDNPMVMKKFEIDNQVNRLKSIRNAYINEHRRMEDEVQLILPKQIHKLRMTVEYYKGDMEFAEQNPEPDPFDIEIGVTTTTSVPMHLKRLFNKKAA